MRKSRNWSGRTCLAFTGTIVALLIVLVAPPAPAASYWQPCYPPSVFIRASLRAHDVHCGKARRVIEGFMREAQAEGPDLFIGGFHCVAVAERVSCSRGDQHIKLHGVAG
jgi:hypothetical protein